jgi:CRP-like cAMP-binding protein
MNTQANDTEYELDFFSKSSDLNYDPVLALEFFKSVGNVENIAAENYIFAENEEKENPYFRAINQRDKMYLLLEGEVDFLVKNTSVGTAKKGEMFGEIAFLTQTPRSATAMAKTDCSLISLDNTKFQSALRKTPDFALTLMIVMVGHLRKMISRFDSEETPSARKEWKESTVFSKKLLAKMVDEFGDGSRIFYEKGKVIIEEGRAGIAMYVVQEGRVAVSIQNRIVEKVGPGGIFGEMELLERGKRLSKAVAETDCSLLTITRNILLDLVKDDPEFGVAILSALAERVRFIASRHSV